MADEVQHAVQSDGFQIWKLTPYSAIVYRGGDGYSVNVLATFRTRNREPTIRAEQDDLQLFVRNREFPYWVGLSNGEEVGLRAGDEYGVGLPWEYVPSLHRWVVKQKSH